jgi:hypothetical protein
MIKNGKLSSGTRFRCIKCGKSIIRKFNYLNSHFLSSGIDYLRGYCELEELQNPVNEFTTDIFDPIWVINNLFFRLLDVDNSSSINGVKFFGEEFDVQRKDKSLFFSRFGENLFNLRLNTSKDSKRLGFTSSFTFDFYGTYFALQRLGVQKDFNFQGFLKKFLSFFDPKITRIDYCFDFNLSIKELLKDSTFGQKTSEYYDQDGKVETLYFGNVKGQRRLITRIYDKKKLVGLKKQEYLYPYISQNENVTRIEYEIKSALLVEFCFDWTDLFDDVRLKSLVKSLSQTTKKHLCFDFDDVPRISRKYPESSEAKLEYYFDRMRKQYISAKKSGINLEKLKERLDSEAKKYHILI